MDITEDGLVLYTYIWELISQILTILTWSLDNLELHKTQLLRILSADMSKNILIVSLSVMWFKIVDEHSCDRIELSNMHFKIFH